MREIPLTQGQVAVVDDDDYERLSKYKWRARNIKGIWYARTNVPCADRACGYITTSMHHMVLGNGRIDHRNGNGLDNRKENLRFATQRQNCMNRTRLRSDNTSGLKGVTKYRGRWMAKVGLKYLGLFDTPELAAAAYDAEAQKLFGEFASPNNNKKGKG